ncbi:MAG TPA: branched-chain amino acid ABC transporter permease [Kofleriaceae bacterium]|nr:branched-chain amino acid ABC transporter permease [Kofleriaceae bacterium]
MSGDPQPMAVPGLAARLAAHRRPVWVALLDSTWPFLIGLALAFAMQTVIAPAVGDYYGRMLVDVGIAIVLAVSLNIVNGYCGQFSLGHAGFMAVGGYTAAALVYYGSIRWFHVTVPGDPYGGSLGPGEWLLAGSCVAGGLTAAALGFVVGLPSLRLRGDYLAIVTLGFGEIVRVFLQETDPMVPAKEVPQHSMWSLMDNLGGAGGFKLNPKYIDPQNPFWVWIFVVLVLIVAYRLKQSSKGRQLLAVRENEIAAEAMGVQTTRVKVSAFVIAAFFAGIGGGLFAHELGNSLNPGDLGFQKSIDIVIMVVLGGMGSITGVVAAATMLTVLPELFREFSQYRMIVYALALILMMILRPQGLFGIRELWELGPWRKVFARHGGGAPPPGETKGAAKGGAKGGPS